MESVLSLPKVEQTEIPLASARPPSKDSLIIESLTPSGSRDQVAFNFKDLYKALTITARSIVDKLNELLKGKYPEGLEHLRPEDATSEKTADRIVTGVAQLFSAYAKQNPQLKGEELLSSFMKQAREGVDRGYGEAYKTLGDLGAFQQEGVESRITETRRLIDEKLAKFEEQKRRELTEPVEHATATFVNDSLLAAEVGQSPTLKLAA